ncbi:hypothetical protein [Adlercreutzia caecimuris]|jgi:ribosomal protein L37E|uniref:hypothetical protein n=1 Tax=Adlercreutzia caecimuris TaxID=671266 RepID=UPI001C3C211E|nr:hypothetical protein [Adlercreutzia caecimuris]
MNENQNERNRQEGPEEETVRCPRCGADYPSNEWQGECRLCGYPDAYYDSF